MEFKASGFSDLHAINAFNIKYLISASRAWYKSKFLWHCIWFMRLPKIYMAYHAQKYSYLGFTEYTVLSHELQLSLESQEHNICIDCNNLLTFLIIHMSIPSKLLKSTLNIAVYL